MKAEEVIEFVRKSVEPLPALDSRGERYRVSGTLRDGTMLPCLIVESTTRRVEQALKRFEETKKSNDPYMGYQAIVRSFVTKGNTINDYDLRELSACKFAIPVARLREIGGETSMAWTEFYAIMSNGAEFRFGTGFSIEFFEMPEGYSATDIQRITPAVRGETPRSERIYRERPFFTCYVDGL